MQILGLNKTTLLDYPEHVRMYYRESFCFSYLDVNSLYVISL